MIESIYLLLDSLYCSQLRDFLSGYSCQTEAFSGSNLYNEIGLVTFALILLTLVLYYKVFDPSEGKLFKWGIALGVTSLLSAFGAYFWAYRAESKGFIGRCLLKDDNGNNLIGFMDYVGLGISNAIIAAVFFFILSFAIRYISVNNRYIPF